MTQMKYETILAEGRNDKTAVLTLNRPDKRNALSILMRQEISACLEKWKDDEKIGAVIITGAGKAFCAGFDLSEFSEKDKINDVFESSAKYHRDVWKFPKPVIAAINGNALGGGFDLATLCDIRLCSESAVFGHPEIKFGAPPLFTPLRWLVGDGIARELCLTGRKIDANEAHRTGLVSEITSQENLMPRAHEYAKLILESPPEALRVTKRYLTGNPGLGFEESFKIEHDEVFREMLLKKLL